MTSRASLRWIERGLCFSGLILLGLWLANYGETLTFQATESEQFDAALRRGEPAAPVPDRSEHRARGTNPVLGRLVIPRLKISAMIGEGIDSGVLQRAVGHVRSTARPGEPGNVALAGHRDTFFRGLRRVRNGDAIRIETLGGTYAYRVQWGAVVRSRRVDLLDSTRTRSLTLVTCYPFEMIGRAPDRFVVRAEQVASWARNARRPTESGAPIAKVRTLRPTSERQAPERVASAFPNGVR